MYLKDNTINPLGIKPEIIIAMIITNTIFSEVGYNLKITCLTEGKHIAENSDHYKGYAFDCGSKELPTDIKKKVLQRLKTELNNQYQVLLESEGGSNEHFHISYKPSYQ